MHKLLSSVLDRVAQLQKKVSVPRKKPGGQRFLVREILSLQLMITSVIGALAIASLYWGAQWVLQNSYSRWALQWTEELHELGAPLYVSFDNDVTTRIEEHITKYPEIRRVTYYRLDGSTMFSIKSSERERAPGFDRLPETIRAKAGVLVGTDTPYLIESSIADVSAFHIYAPIWTESILHDGLFDFDPLADTQSSSQELVGYVSLSLDFVGFHDHLVSNIETTVLVFAVLLILSMVAARLLLRGALKPISDLHGPISELANGNLSVEFKPAAHREIADIVEALESTASALSERDAKLLELANHDPLTGLYNRRRFVDELETQAKSISGEHASHALLFIDLDRFKYVNDVGGHPAGDRLITKVAELLEDSVGGAGLVARFGGDEFAVIAKNSTKQEAKALADTILERMRGFRHVEAEHVFHMQCSIGVTMLNTHNRDTDELLAQADIACREAKIRGRNRHAFFDSTDHESALIADVGWMAKLNDAFERELFVLHYQPIAEICSGQITHHEVLLRMRTDVNSKKLIYPDAFLPAAVRFGRMEDIDRWVIENAIGFLAERLHDDGDLRFAINLSPSAFEMNDLVSFIRGCLEEHKVPPTSVVFEITETVALRHLTDIKGQVASLRELGCGMALDDFGIGYSSFGQLRQLPVDFLKIDGSFVASLVDEEVDQKTVELIGEIAKASGIKTIAEHVASQETYELLGKLGIDYAQGVHVGEPFPVPERKVLPELTKARRAKGKTRGRRRA